MSRLASIEARFHRVETALGNMESDDVDVVSSSGSLSNSDGRSQIGLINVVRELEEKISLLDATKLDSIGRRVAALSSELEKAIKLRKRLAKSGTSTSDSNDDPNGLRSEKINELYSLVESLGK